MSYYYCYRLGYQKGGKIYPLFPFRADGTWEDIISHSRSYETGLHENCCQIRKDMVSDELKARMLKGYAEEGTEDEHLEDALHYWKWMPLSALPTGSFVKSGYFLTEEVQQYQYALEHGDCLDDLDIFYDSLTPTVYSTRLSNYMAIKIPDGKLDEGGNVLVHPVTDYMYFAYPDYNCKEYDAFMIRSAVDMCNVFTYDNDDIEIVVIDVEG